MVAELKPGFSRLLVEGLEQRAKGYSEARIAAGFGYQNIPEFRTDWRRAYETELGVANPATAAAKLVSIKELDLKQIAQGRDLKGFTRLPRADRQFIEGLITPKTPSGIQDDMAYDYDPHHTSEIARQTGATNLIQETLLYMEFLNQHPEAQRGLRSAIPISAPRKKRAHPSVKDRSPSLSSSDSEKSETSGKLIGTVLTQRQGDILRLAATGDDRTMTMRKLGIGNRETYRQQLSAAIEAAGLKNGKGLNPKDARGVVLTSRLELTRRLMTSGEVDPVEIAKADFESPELLVKAFGKLTPLEAQIVKLLDLGKNPSQITADLSQLTEPNHKKPNTKFILRMISFIYEKVRAKTLIHLFVLSEANNRLKATGVTL